MFADLSHSTSTSLANRLTLFIWRVSRAFEVSESQHLPAELGRLSDHLLCDIGVDPRSIRVPPHEATTNLELLRREWP